MRKRNPLFVAGFPYIVYLIGYASLNVLSSKTNESDKLNSVQVAGLISGIIIILVAVIYIVYWLVSTAKELRQHYGAEIPSSLLLIVPIANYWWVWRYGAGVDKVTNGKISTVLTFILIILLGSIGMGILQDTFNKLPAPHPGGQFTEKPQSGDGNHPDHRDDPPHNPIS